MVPYDNNTLSYVIVLRRWLSIFIYSSVRCNNKAVQGIDTDHRAAVAAVAAAYQFVLLQSFFPREGQGDIWFPRSSNRSFKLFFALLNKPSRTEAELVMCVL
jgi:hypothetical protein